MSALNSNPDGICSGRAFLTLTLNGHDGLQSRDITASNGPSLFMGAAVFIPLLGLSRDYAAATDCPFEFRASNVNSETGLGRPKK
jgi:hypothetical protein